MNDIGAYLLTVLVDEIHIKILGNSTVQLDCDHRVFFAVYVLSLDVDLRAVECCFAVGLCKRNLFFYQQITDLALCFFPVLLVPEILFAVVGIPFGHVF